jgi:hypothetical protein
MGVMTHTLRRLALLVATVALSQATLSCGRASTAPESPPPDSVLQFPKESGADVYLNDNELFLVYETSRRGWVTTRYVLRNDGTFSLQFLDTELGFNEYPGHYTRNDSLFVFQFTGPAGPQSASGLLYGNRLLVSYDEATSPDLSCNLYDPQPAIHQPSGDFFCGFYDRQPAVP